MLNVLASFMLIWFTLSGVFLCGLWVGWGFAEEHVRELRMRQEMPSAN